jgi:ribose-phosphate pyrophosphokinase
MLVLGFPEYAAQAEAMARELGGPFEPVAVHVFPDGESRVRLPPSLPEHVVICRSLDAPNGKLVELMLAAECARSLGAERLTLVAPYLCYMRQDIAFRPGEAVSQRIVGRFLAELFDSLVTVDPHLHRTHSLLEAVPVARATALSAAPAMGKFLAARAERPLLVGPDEEAEQWVQVVAAVSGLEYAVAKKIRHGDERVDVRLPNRDFTGREIVLVDDVASTGHTIAKAVRALRGAGATAVDVLVTHALMVGDAADVLRAAGVGRVWSSDSVGHATNAFPLATMLASAVRRLVT